MKRIREKLECALAFIVLRGLTEEFGEFVKKIEELPRCDEQAPSE